jgi:hypothetical protein
MNESLADMTPYRMSLEVRVSQKNKQKKTKKCNEYLILIRLDNIPILTIFGAITTYVQQTKIFF